MAPVARNATLADLKSAIYNQAEAHAEILTSVCQSYEQRIEALEKGHTANQREVTTLKTNAADAAIERQAQFEQLRQQMADEKSRARSDRQDLVHQLDLLRSSLAQNQHTSEQQMKALEKTLLDAFEHKIASLRRIHAVESASNASHDIPSTGDDSLFVGEQDDQPFEPAESVTATVGGAVATQTLDIPNPTENDAAPPDDDVIMLGDLQPVTEGDLAKAMILQHEENRRSRRTTKVPDQVVIDEFGNNKWAGYNAIKSLTLYGEREHSVISSEPSSSRWNSQRPQIVHEGPRSLPKSYDADYVPPEVSIASSPDPDPPRPLFPYRRASDSETLASNSQPPVLRNDVLDPLPAAVQGLPAEQRFQAPSQVPYVTSDRNSSNWRTSNGLESRAPNSKVTPKKQRKPQSPSSRRKRKADDTLGMGDDEIPLAFAPSAPASSGTKKKGTANLSIRDALNSSSGNRVAGTPKSLQKKTTVSPTKRNVPNPETPTRPSTSTQNLTSWMLSANPDQSPLSARANPSPLGNPPPAAPTAVMRWDSDSPAASQDPAADLLRRFQAVNHKTNSSTKNT